MTLTIEQDTCEVCGHPVDEFEDHGFGRLMVGVCDDCSLCNTPPLRYPKADGEATS